MKAVVRLRRARRSAIRLPFIKRDVREPGAIQDRGAIVTLDGSRVSDGIISLVDDGAQHVVLLGARDAAPLANDASRGDVTRAESVPQH